MKDKEIQDLEDSIKREKQNRINQRKARRAFKSSKPRYPSLTGTCRDLALLMHNAKSGNIGLEEAALLAQIAYAEEILRLARAAIGKRKLEDEEEVKPATLRENISKAFKSS